MTFNLDGYVDVATRIKLFYARHPEGSLQMDQPEFVQVEGKQWVMGRACAYRTPDDQRPGVGWAWEVIPGTTPYTRGSEIQNLQTSAFGRAIGALGIGIEASIATLDEIEHAKERQKVMRTTEADPQDPWVTEAPKKDSYSTGKTSKGSSMYPCTKPQLSAVHAILGKQGLNDDLDKLAKVNEYLVGLNKEPVGAISEVDKHQCSLLIDHLQAGLSGTTGQPSASE